MNKNLQQIIELNFGNVETSQVFKAILSFLSAWIRISACRIMRVQEEKLMQI